MINKGLIENPPEESGPEMKFPQMFCNYHGNIRLCLHHSGFLNLSKESFRTGES